MYTPLPRPDVCLPSILMVDEDEQVRQFSANALEQVGYRVLQARNPKDAFTIWEGSQSLISVLLTQMLLPTGTGTELAVEFRKAQPKLKVILISPEGERIAAETSRLIKGAKILRKPYSPLGLVKMVQTTLAS